MTSHVKNVILLGGTSLTGKGFVEYVSSKGDIFETVTVTSRSLNRPTWLPSTPNYKLAQVDFNSHESLVSALKGHDAAVGLIGAEVLHLQPAIVDAAIEAGVQVFIPSDFGFDVSTENPNLDKLLELPVPFWTVKADNHRKLEEKVEAGKIKRISISTGPFLDWGLGNGLLGFNVKEKKATIYDGGDEPTNAITTPKLGEVIARALLSPKYYNTTIYVNSVVFTQNAILRQLEEKTGEKWTVERKTSKETIEFGKKLAKTSPLFGAYAIIAGVAYSPEGTYGRPITTEDAIEFGLELDNAAEVVEKVS